MLGVAGWDGWNGCWLRLVDPARGRKIRARIIAYGEGGKPTVTPPIIQVQRRVVGIPNTWLFPVGETAGMEDRSIGCSRSGNHYQASSRYVRALIEW